MYWVCQCCPRDSNLGNATLQAKLYSCVLSPPPAHLLLSALCMSFMTQIIVLRWLAEAGTSRSWTRCT